MKSILPALALLCLLAACTPNSTSVAQQKPVDPPLKDITIPDETYSINADETDTIITASGTSICIPKGTLVDENGKAVGGTVRLAYREFHSAAEIIASGINMMYDSAGVKSPFESAGMFELRAFKNDRPVFIRKGGQVNMSMVSYRDGGYNFYELDTIKNNWTYLSSNMPDTNVAFQKIEAALAALGVRPAEPQGVDPKLPMINFDIDPSMRPELASYNNVMWQYTGTGPDPEKDKRVYTTSWSKMSIVPNADESTYTLSLASSNEKFSTNIRPVLEGQDLAAARNSFREKLANWEEKRQAHEDKLAATAPYTRNVTVRNFGFGNCDRIFARPDMVTVNAAFKYNNEAFDNHPNDVVLYLIADNLAIPVASGSGYSLRFSPSMSNGLIAILRNSNEVVVMKKADFAKVKTSNGSNTRFEFNAGTEKAKTWGDFNTIVGQL